MSVQRFALLREALARRVLGQEALVDRLLIALLADGHLLLEGPPGLAKTRAVRVLAGLIDAPFHRVQFTPDLLPADLTGGEVFRPQDGSFHFEPGPVFHSLLLADEINRAPAKVQSALLEAMAERQVTVGRTSYPLPPLFMVLATQNPIEHEGTYPLPEAQLDRFLMKVSVAYPERAAERAILDLARREGQGLDDAPTPLMRPEEVLAARAEVARVHVADSIADYVVDLVGATRRPESVDPDLVDAVAYGASPRGAIGLERAARARAWLAGRDFVLPEDVTALAPDVLRHRLWLRYEALARGLDADEIIRRLLARLPAP